ncbi:DNA adenine methylase [bacterium]|nr:DNA adenine methylase [bacterium]
MRALEARSLRAVMPSTRYQGSKRKLLPWLEGIFSRLEFDSCLDAFGGTGSVSHLLKAMGKEVAYNDALLWNATIGRALVENDSVRLEPARARALAERSPLARCPDFIERTFAGIYFTRDENRWLDAAVANVRAIEPGFARDLAFFAIFQSCLAKRPYNLFHRKNLYMRTATIERSFGNKATWDRPFDEHFLAHVLEANAAVFEGRRRCRALCSRAEDVEGEFDLVYVDPPYLNRRGIGVDYRDFYHFLEGLVRYESWPALVDLSSRHRRFLKEKSEWSDARRIARAFSRVFERFERSTIVVSYRSEGIPSIDELARALRRVKRRVVRHDQGGYQYALSTNRKSREVVLVGS